MMVVFLVLLIVGVWVWLIVIRIWCWYCVILKWIWVVNGLCFFLCGMGLNVLIWSGLFFIVCLMSFFEFEFCMSDVWDGLFVLYVNLIL